MTPSFPNVVSTANQGEVLIRSEKSLDLGNDGSSLSGGKKGNATDFNIFNVLLYKVKKKERKYISMHIKERSH